MRERPLASTVSPGVRDDDEGEGLGRVGHPRRPEGTCLYGVPARDNGVDDSG